MFCLFFLQVLFDGWFVAWYSFWDSTICLNWSKQLLRLRTPTLIVKKSEQNEELPDPLLSRAVRPKASIFDWLHQLFGVSQQLARGQTRLFDHVFYLLKNNPSVVGNIFWTHPQPISFSRCFDAEASHLINSIAKWSRMSQTTGTTYAAGENTYRLLLRIRNAPCFLP